MPMLPQPDPDLFRHKHAMFERLQEMALQMHKLRRAMGYQWLEGGVDGIGGVLEDAGTSLLHVRQSGLTVVTLVNPNPRMGFDTQQGMSRNHEFHRELIGGRTHSEFVWDEAMLTDRMS